MNASGASRVGVRTAAVALLLLASTVGVLPGAGAQAPAPQSAQSEWRGVDKVVAFADVHGAHVELVALLRESGIIDASERWSAGRTHVVSLGDLLDRGADSRKVMDLLMRLQGEAATAGGALHVVIGNHEAMNVLGDLRYVAPGEYAAYADVESAEVRARERAAWMQRNGPDAGGAFDVKFPPGYFGHRAALGPQGKYGRWILGLPVAVKVNDTLFMHAGPSSELRGMSLAELNTRYRTALVDYLGLADRLGQAGLLLEGDDFNARPKLAAQRLAALGKPDAPPPAALAADVEAFRKADEHPLLNPDGPNWYRGAALCREVSEADVLDPLLRQFGATRLVIGHSVTRDQRAVTRFDGRVVKLDAGMNRAVYKGRGAALAIEGANLSVRYSGEPAAVPLAPEGLFVAPDAFPDGFVAAALQAGTVTVTGPRGPDLLDVTVQHEGHSIPAVFMARKDDAARREVAAYQLDRKLGLGLVPATALREVQGQSGVVQARPAKWLTQADVQKQSVRGGGWCALEPQFQLVYAFDGLVGNEGRTLESLVLDAEDWFVFATDHQRTFGSSRSLPAYLKAQPPKLGTEMRRRLAALDEATLEATLGDAVDDKARKAMLQRRDALLALPAAASAGR